MYHSPNGKDATPNDRFNKHFPNVSTCEPGCMVSHVDLETFEIKCECKLNDIMICTFSTGIAGKILEDSFGEVFEMIDNK